MRPSSRSSSFSGGLRFFGTNDWFIDSRRSVHSSVPRSAALTRIFFRNTCGPSIGKRRPTLFPTDTVSSGTWGKHFAQVSASR